MTIDTNHRGTDESTLVPAALAGDESAFTSLTRWYRRELHVHCYRMLASFEDEVLLATTLSAASERGEAGALPPDSEGNAAFPDLSRSDTDERFQCSVARTVPTAWLSPHHSEYHGAAIENAPAGQPVCFGVLYCVWRI